MIRNLLFLRHGTTAGNLKGSYIGRTDEPLCAAGIEELLKSTCPSAQVWAVSPALRCWQTAFLLRRRAQERESAARELLACEKSADYGKLLTKDTIVVEDFRECDFGIFENKNFEELSDCPQYQQWVDSGGTLPFPGGECVEDFKHRCCRAFEELARQMKDDHIQSANLIVHGGTIMSILESFARPKKDYYSWHVRNGEGYRAELDDEQWKESRCFRIVEKITLAGNSSRRQEVHAASE